MRYGLMMAAGCVLPFFLIFLLPVFGVDEGFALFIGIALMFGCHLFMAAHHHGGHETEPTDRLSQGDTHEHPEH